MRRILILVDSVGSGSQTDGTPSSTTLMVSALKQAILDDLATPNRAEPNRAELAPTEVGVEVRAVASLMQEFAQRDLIGQEPSVEDLAGGDRLICPLTLDLPDWLTFPGQDVYRACRDEVALAQQVQSWGYRIGQGNLWLPIVLTAKGALYAEVVGQQPVTEVEPSDQPNSLKSTYIQPVHLPDIWRQPLYKLGQRLLHHLQAPPAVYLMQFGLPSGELCFERLLPFPAAPAIASLDVQAPNLFSCHWRCLTGKPILDLEIKTSTYSQPV